MFFMRKQAKKTEFDTLLARAFTRENLFVNTICELVGHSPSLNTLHRWLSEIEADKTITKEFYLHAIRRNEEIFELNCDSADYALLLVDTHKLVCKCSSILYVEPPTMEGYLQNELTEAVYILTQLDAGLRKGVPMQHETIQKAVATVHHLITDALNNYYKVSLEPLETELELAKQLRIDYIKRRSIAFNQAE